MSFALRRLAGALLLLVLGHDPGFAQVYSLDRDHKEVRFSWDHLGISRQGGRFDDIAGTVKFDPEHPETSTVEDRKSVV